MGPQDFVRSVILSPKRTVSGKNGVLDLSYITTRLIAAASPTDGEIRMTYRTPLYRLIDHLDRRHTAESTGYWHIWNLHAEGPLYQVNEALTKYWSFRPFPDHNPPSLLLMHRIVTEIDCFLEENPHNVALVHCHEGKGRTGTICCAYLMYESKARGIELSASSAREIYTEKRMRRFFGSGVSAKCQIRYLDYWEKYLKLDRTGKLNWRLYHLLEVTKFSTRLSRITKVCVYNPSVFLMGAQLKLSTYEKMNEANVPVELCLNIVSSSDFIKGMTICEFNQDHEPLTSMQEIKVSFTNLLCSSYAWFNAFFESFEGDLLAHPTSSKATHSVSIPWSDFDGAFGLPGGRSRSLFDYVVVYWELELFD